MSNPQTAPPPEIRKIGCFGAQPVELHTGTADLYIGGRNNGTLGTVLANRYFSQLLRLNIKTEVEEHIVATTLAKERIKLSTFSHILQIENRERFLNAMTHAVAREKPHGNTADAREIRTELDIVLDDAKKICQNSSRNGQQ